MGFLFILLSWLAICAKDARTEVIPATFSGFPGDKVEVNTTNYQQLPASFHEMKYGTEYESVHYLRPYDMTERLVYTFLFTLKGDTGYIEIVFQEYDLNPRSVLYLYNGGNESSAGTIWTHHSPVPVYHSTSSGAPLFMVFKTGQDAANKHMGFVANVYFKEKLWESPPMTGFCAPLKTIVQNRYEFMRTEIVYNSNSQDAQVFCSYTSHVRNEELVVVSTVPETKIDVWDFPSAAVGKRISHRQFGNVSYGDIYMEMYVYNLSSAIYGFHLELAPRFTKPLQRLIFGIGLTSMLLRIEITQPGFSQHLPSDWNCPYKRCPFSKTNRCHDIHEPCLYESQFEDLDGTCDLHPVQPEIYSVCEGSKHCYHVYTDHCDGFSDCVDGSDEEECDRFDDNTTQCDATDATITQHHGYSPSKWIDIIVPSVSGVILCGGILVYVAIRKRQAIRRFFGQFVFIRGGDQSDNDAILSDEDS